MIHGVPDFCRSAATIATSAADVFCRGLVKVAPFLLLFCPSESDASGVARLLAIQCEAMRQQHVMSEGTPVGCDRLRSVNFNYVDFDGQARSDGEIVVMDAAAPHVLHLFTELFYLGFPIAHARPLTVYRGDDLASMNHNNTSAFNDRPVTGKTTLSLHAYGLAIDINPIQNPFIVRNGSLIVVLPPAGAGFTDRTLRSTPQGRGMAEHVVVDFCRAGFPIWGGSWSNPIDYQHFQVTRSLAERLARLSAPAAKKTFDASVRNSARACGVHAPRSN
jgi:hypothetical protein